jgi:hypothetical protein
MEIIITEWALDSYLALKGKQAFSDAEYWKVMRPDVLLLKSYPTNPKFGQNKFWSEAQDSAKVRIPNGFKMKWHQMGNGKVQIRLPVGLFADALLCEAYVKENPKQEARRLARFKTHLQLIRQGRYTERGRLS